VKTKTIKVIIIPDVHGRPFWREVLTNKEDTIVFLGDYSDPYEYAGFTHKDAVRELTDIDESNFIHTQQRNNPILVGSMWCLDCRKVFVLEGDTISYYSELGDKMEFIIVH